MNLRHPAMRVLALSALLAATLSVSACGRRGGLEAPPGAVVAAPEPAAQGPIDPATGKPKPARKRIPLDALLD